MYDETYCGRRVISVATYGVMEVYMIPTYRKMSVCKYMVFHKNGQAIEPAHTKREAIRWAKEHQNDAPPTN